MITKPGESALNALRAESHPQCVVCGLANGHGLGLEFHLVGDGVVEASFACERMFEGYPATLHGGVICTLLDGAMTNCMFAHGRTAVTAELSVRFRHPVAIGQPVTVRAWIESSLNPLYHLAGEVRQAGQVMATAKGKFMDSTAKPWLAPRPPRNPP